MEYDIIFNEDPAILKDQINLLGQEGWNVAGGISSTTDKFHTEFNSSGDKVFENIHTFYQAMTRTKKPAKTTREKQAISPTEVINSYNKYFAKYPVAPKLRPTPKLINRLKVCIRKDFKTLDEWKGYFELIEMDDFLMGKIAPTNGYNKQFKLSLDYIINETNISKIIER